LIDVATVTTYLPQHREELVDFLHVENISLFERNSFSQSVGREFQGFSRVGRTKLNIAQEIFKSLIDIKS
jgi:hypothetical protein